MTGDTDDIDEVSIQCLTKDLPISKEIIVDSPPHFFTLPTTMAAVGPRGRGKTYNLTVFNEYLVRKGYITRVYVISPTFDSNTLLKENLPVFQQDVYGDVNMGPESILDVQEKVIREYDWYTEITQKYYPKYQMSKQKGFEEIPEEDQKYLLSMQPKIELYYNDLMEAIGSVNIHAPLAPWMENTLEMFQLPKQHELSENAVGNEEFHEEYIHDSKEDLTQYLWEPPPGMQKPAPLLFIDDMSHSTIFGSTSPLINLLLRHRHLGGQGAGLTIQFGVQSFKGGIPRALRTNTMQFLLFKTNDLTALEDIYEELGAFTTKKRFIEMYHHAVKGKHDFMVVDVNPRDERSVFRKGFETVMLNLQPTEEEIQEEVKKCMKTTPILSDKNLHT